MSAVNKALIRRWVESIQSNLELVDELIAPHHILHSGDIKTSGHEELKQILSMIHTAFPDLAITMDDQIAEGDKEVHRWTARATHQGDFMGVPATGKTVTFTAIYMSQIVDGQIVEEWGLLDTFAIMQQIGAFRDQIQMAHKDVTQLVSHLVPRRYDNVAYSQKVSAL